MLLTKLNQTKLNINYQYEIWVDRNNLKINANGNAWKAKFIIKYLKPYNCVWIISIR